MTIHERHERHERPDAGDDAASARVRALLSAAAAPSEPGPVPGEGEALAAFRAARPAPERTRMLSRITTVKASLAASATVGLLAAGTVSAAAAGVLPGAAQDTAHDMLSKVGVTVPGPAAASDGHADTRVPAADDTEETGENTPDETGEVTSEDVETTDDETTDEETTEDSSGEDAGKGAAVSELARTTESTGVDKGAEISGFASEGRSHAGQNGKAADAGKPADHPAEHEATEDEATDDEATDDAHEATEDSDEHDDADEHGDAGTDRRP